MRERKRDCERGNERGREREKEREGKISFTKMVPRRERIFEWS